MRLKRSWIVVLVLALLLAVALGVQPVPVAHAATITVNTTNDEFNTDGDCSLREAILAANTNSAVDGCIGGWLADTITLPAGTYTLTILGADEEASATGDLDITGDLTINVNGAGSTIIRAGTNSINGIDRVLDVHAGVTVEINDVTITYGRAPGIAGEQHGGGIRNYGRLTLNNSTVDFNTADWRGGGIYNGGTLTLNNSTVSNNRGRDGGGIYNSGILTLNNSTVSNNHADNYGGGIYNSGTLTLDNSFVRNNDVSGNYAYGGGIYNLGILTLDNSTVNSNTADSTNIFNYAYGGGIYDYGTLTLYNSTVYSNRADYGGGIDNDGGTLMLNNCTVNSNDARRYGGGIYTDDRLTLFHTTITSNWADANNDGVGDGGGVAVFGGTTNVINTIIGDNQDRGGEAHDCLGTLTSQGYNLVEDTTGCTFTPRASDVTGEDPNLGLLAYNGGSTRTRALLAGSPAIERIPDGINWCQAGASTDQRGYVRAGGPGNGGSSCDIGAYEYDTVPLAPPVGPVYLPIVLKNH